MTLDSLPIVAGEVLGPHGARHRNEAEYKLWLLEVDRYLKTKNPVLDFLIEVYARESQDPQAVRGLGYTLITFIDQQLSADKIKEEMEK